MSKPGRKLRTPSEEIAHFADREDKQELFRRHLYASTEPPVLVFYGVGGAGKTWLLKKLRQELPADIPSAFLDFDQKVAGGRRYALDPAAALYDIREQLGKPTPKFDLAFGVLRVKRGSSEEAGFLGDLPADLVGLIHPTAGTALKWLTKPALASLKGTSLGKFLTSKPGQKFARELDLKTAQDIEKELLDYLVGDLRRALASHLNRAVSVVLFFDTFEAVSAESQSEEHKRQHEQWFREVASSFDFALTIIAGQNRLTWDDIDPGWEDFLDQHPVGGLSESDAHQFLEDCGISDHALQGAILSTAKEKDGGHHCFSLGLCVDIVVAERAQGKITTSESLRLAPRDWESLAHRFLKSLGSDAEIRWIQRLALTLQFDERAARAAFSEHQNTAQDAAWEKLPDYSFVELLAGDANWLSIREQMRRALENQPSAGERVVRDHAWWAQYWESRSVKAADREASLRWYHSYCIDPQLALQDWCWLVYGAVNGKPPHMDAQFELLRWWEMVGLTDDPDTFTGDVDAIEFVADGLTDATLGSRSRNLHRAITYYEAVIRVLTEGSCPERWASIQKKLGAAWAQLPTGERSDNLSRAIDYYEAALRVFTEKDFPEQWADLQSDLGIAWRNLPAGSLEDNLLHAIRFYENALRVCTEQALPRGWARTQINLGNVWLDRRAEDRRDRVGRAIAYYEAALRVLTEVDYPAEWALTQLNLGNAWSELPAEDRSENLRRAIDYYEAALRYYTEQNFPRQWAATQSYMGLTREALPFGDRKDIIRCAISHYEAALRVFTLQDFPQQCDEVSNNLRRALAELKQLGP